MVIRCSTDVPPIFLVPFDCFSDEGTMDVSVVWALFGVENRIGMS